MNNAIRTLVPALVGGVAGKRRTPMSIDSSKLETDVDPTGRERSARRRGQRRPGRRERRATRSSHNIFGGNDSNAVASALAGGGAGNSDLIKKLLPILAPIVLAYIGKQLTKSNAPAEPRRRRRAAAASVTCWAASSAAPAAAGNNPLGSILGSVLGGSGGGNNALGSILGGLLGGKK